MKQVRRCPKCRSEKLLQFSFRRDPVTGKKVARPVSMVNTLLVAAPWGLLCIYMLINSGLWAGYGIWLLGLIAAVLGSFFARRQNRHFRQLKPEYEFECQDCQHRWEAPAEL